MRKRRVISIWTDGGYLGLEFIILSVEAEACSATDLSNWRNVGVWV